MSSDLVLQVVEEGSPPTRNGRRGYVLRFDSVVIEPRMIATFRKKPEEKFSAHHLVIPDFISSSSFTIVELAVESALFLEDVSAVLFDESFLQMRLPDVVCPIYKNMVLAVRNDTDVPCEFAAEIIGEVVS